MTTLTARIVGLTTRSITVEAPEATCIDAQIGAWATITVRGPASPAITSAVMAAAYAQARADVAREVDGLRAIVRRHLLDARFYYRQHHVRSLMGRSTAVALGGVEALVALAAELGIDVSERAANEGGQAVEREREAGVVGGHAATVGDADASREYAK